jgi:FKBP-type peptidyl-prolyl cis-trans isomerase FkpA
MKKIISLISVLVICSTISIAQNKKKANAKKPMTFTSSEKGAVANPAAASTKKAAKKEAIKWVKFNNSLDYCLYTSKGRGPKIVENNYMFVDMEQWLGDSILLSTYQQGGAILNKVVPAGGSLDIMPILLLARAGDSLNIRFNPDSIFKNGKPPFYVEGSDVGLNLHIDSILSKQGVDSLEAESAKQALAAAEQVKMQRMQARQNAGTLAVEQDSIIEAYIKANNMIAKKSNSGLYYVVTQQGSGPNATAGKQLTMNYTGLTLDGNTFDSNVDPAFGHVQPFTFVLGKGMVIQGWDEGMELFNKGTKATLIIPSYLGYGANGAGEKIPPNAILRFDVEVVDFN